LYCYTPNELSPQELSPRELPVAINEQCTSATIIENPLVESIIPGDTNGITFQNTVPCGDLPNPSIGLWYQIMNQSSDTINVRASIVEIETMLSVFTGTDCTTLQCVSFSSIVDFQVFPNSTYWIFVDGSNGGNFTLEVGPIPVRGNISLF
jgi:hypothetical protein